MYDNEIRKYGFIPFDHKEPHFFPVLEAQVYDSDGKPIPNYKRIERGDTGDTLAIHTDAYKMVPYERHFQLFEDAIKASKLPWSTMQIGTDMERNGAKIFRQYLFPQALGEIRAVTGTRPQLLQIFTFDSYDGTTAFTGRAGAFDAVCCNSMYHGLSLMDFSFRHVGDMESKVQMAAGRLTNAAEKFIENINRMQTWTRIGLSASDVGELISVIPQSSKALTDHFIAAYAQQPDDTMWGLHQLLTAWATHDIPRRTQADRSKRIATLIESKHWKELEAA
jgi:hypothetical protein